MARVVVVDPARPNSAAIDDAARVLRAGGLVAFPTETVYGLGARALDDTAVERIFAAKGRPRAHPVIAHVAGEDDASSLAAAWTETASRLARAFWPGPLTLVVPRAARVPAAVGGGTDSIGVRAPSHPVARALIAALGEPIAAPSANRFQALSPTLASHVLASLGDAVDLILDGGPCERGLESTVVDVRGAHPAVLRPGSVDLAMLRAVDPRVEDAPRGSLGRDDARPSPGMDPRHYAPRARLVLAPSTARACATADERAARGEGVALVLLGSGAHPAIRADVRVLRMPDEPAAYASALYATLHELDAARVDVIVVQTVPDDDAWRAVADRLERASAT